MAWLLINIFADNNIISYGTSPRFAWLEPNGVALKKYIQNKSVDQLIDICDKDEDYIHCYADHCNCDEPCQILFWL